MPNSYEHSYQHDLDDVIDASDAVLAIGTEKVDTTTLKDRSLTSNDATIHGAMPSNGYFLGRQFDGVDDYLECGNDSSLHFIASGKYTIINIFNCVNVSKYRNYLLGKTAALGAGIQSALFDGKYGIENSNGWGRVESPSALDNNVMYVGIIEYDNQNIHIYLDGVSISSGTAGTFVTDVINAVKLSFYTTANSFNGINAFALIYTESIDPLTFFNTLARLPLYSHNFERYPNSDTSLTSVFPYTSGIITSGSFNKTDGLKCTSAGQIIFSNSFEFDGSEYITLIINGVEYSGTTTVTQGTITATIAQGSNDITIDMGTNDVLEDIRIQFRSEV